MLGTGKPTKSIRNSEPLPLRLGKVILGYILVISWDVLRELHISENLVFIILRENSEGAWISASKLTVVHFLPSLLKYPSLQVVWGVFTSSFPQLVFLRWNEGQQCSIPTHNETRRATPWVLRRYIGRVPLPRSVQRWCWRYCPKLFV